MNNLKRPTKLSLRLSAIALAVTASPLFSSAAQAESKLFCEDKESGSYASAIVSENLLIHNVELQNREYSAKFAMIVGQEAKERGTPCGPSMSHFVTDDHSLICLPSHIADMAGQRFQAMVGFKSFSTMVIWCELAAVQH